MSRVCPVYKHGDRADIGKYRPVSIINNFSKAFETLLQNRLKLNISMQLSDNQHGFVKGRSTVTNLSCISQVITEAIDVGSQVDVIYTDLSKAFDRLDQGILLQKLFNFGFSKELLELFNSYFYNRRQYVALNGHRSVDYSVTSGVPQGSILGPLLFNIFINDICKVLEVECLLYADDLKVFSRIANLSDCHRLQRNLDLVHIWCISNNMTLNISKCNVMTFTLKQKPITYDYQLQKQSLLRPTTFRDLGVIFDSKLSFIAHIETTVNESFKMYGFIVRNSRQFADTATLKMLYCAYVRSKLEYASLVWNPGYAIHINQLESVQRRFLKFLSFKIDGIYPEVGYPNDILNKRFGMSSLESRCIYFSLSFLFKLARNQLHCNFLREKLNFNIPRLTSRQGHTFYLPTPRTNVFKFSPIYSMCNSYNSLCGHIDIFSCSLNELRSRIIFN